MLYTTGTGQLRLALMGTFALVGCVGEAYAQNAGASAADDPGNAGIVRLAVVNTPQFSGLLAALLPEFERDSGTRVEIYSGEDVYEKARAGQADIVISHYGKKEVEGFVLDGYGQWPRMVFANQSVLIGHASDPAGVRGLSSVAEALKRIAEAKAPYIHNEIEGAGYLTETFLDMIGQPERSGWFIESGRRNGAAALLAEEEQGYVIWGAWPFLRFIDHHKASKLEILVWDDPMLHRIMSATVVNPDKVDGVNAKAAQALLDYLLSPPVQAKIAGFRSFDSNLQLWWPAGRDN